MIDDLPVVGEEAAAADPSLLGATDHDAWIVDLSVARRTT